MHSNTKKTKKRPPNVKDRVKKTKKEEPRGCVDCKQRGAHGYDEKSWCPVKQKHVRRKDPVCKKFKWRR